MTSRDHEQTAGALGWWPIETAPRDDDILICLPGGMSDHYYPVIWVEAADLLEDVADGIWEPGPGDLESVGAAGGAWQCRWQTDMVLTQRLIDACHLKPMWQPLSVPPSSLCYNPPSKPPT